MLRSSVWGRFAALVLCCVCAPASSAQTTVEAAWQQLRSGSALLLLRHTDAPGLGDPANFTPGDCSTQRNLSPLGREQAARWGRLLQQQGIAPLRILSSSWCRAIDTGKGMQAGKVETLQALDSFFTERDNANRQTLALIAQINALERSQRLVLISHQVNITALSGIYPASGEGLILALPLTQPPKVLARIAAP
ncbi:histidine phosphatase family protein [Pseudomonas sp.]|uniref:histidine phosphatase family protein n=1 Tax=Pseudomonas sp. TaxID=306 RepID=UPI003FA7A488